MFYSVIFSLTLRALFSLAFAKFYKFKVPSEKKEVLYAVGIIYCTNYQLKFGESIIELQSYNLTIYINNWGCFVRYFLNYYKVKFEPLQTICGCNLLHAAKKILNSVRILVNNLICRRISSGKTI